MPKVPKSTAPRDHRKLPYPAVPSSASMAPYTITPLSSTPQRAMTPPPAATNHHASASWPKEKDELLMRARQQGLNWQPIADQYFPDKSANACRKRHERLMEKRNNADDWDGARMEALAKAYIDVREQMWRVLADRIGGEKWQIVESKCMEKGLKTLQTTGRRTASRRDHDAQNNAGHHGGRTIPEFEDYLTLSPERSRSHPNSDDGFNDSVIGPDADHPFTRPSPQSMHQTPPYGTNNTTTTTNHSFASYPTPSRGHTPNNPGRTFSNASSSIMSASTTGFTPTMATAPLFPSQMHSANAAATRERQNSTGGGSGSGQTLPSFSTTFGMPSISQMAVLPLTSTS